jgi:hypothetical protein
MLLQTRVEFSAPGAPEVLSRRLAATASDVTTATVPPEPVEFAPRSIPIEYLQQLEEAQAGARRMYSAPDPAVSFRELPADPDARFGFAVLDAKEGWMRVELSRGAGEGWVRTDTLAGAADLKGTFPELLYLIHESSGWGRWGSRTTWRSRGRSDRRK